MAAASFPHRGVFALRFAANVFFGSTIAWATLRVLEVTNPIWAVASMIASADPKVDVAGHMFRSRIITSPPDVFKERLPVFAGTGVPFKRASQGIFDCITQRRFATAISTGQHEESSRHADVDRVAYAPKPGCSYTRDSHLSSKSSEVKTSGSLRTSAPNAPLLSANAF